MDLSFGSGFWILESDWVHERLNERLKPGARYAKRCFSESCLSESCLSEASVITYMELTPGIPNNMSTLLDCSSVLTSVAMVMVAIAVESQCELC